MLLPALVLWGKAWQVDEPYFLALARHIGTTPLDPLGFAFNWYGRAEPMAGINNTPPLLPYLLAGALKVSGGGEWATRALFLPCDLAAAWGLLALASRFLKRPLLPVLCVLLGPGWMLTMGHVMAERVMFALVIPALWLLVAGTEDESPRALALSSALTALALLAKLNAAFAVAAGACWLLARDGRPRRAALWSAGALTGLALGAAWSRWAGGGAGGAVWSATSAAATLVVSAPSHKLRALLAFAGGLGPWCLGAAAALKPSRRLAASAAGFCVLLYAPFLDLAPLVEPVDRLTGFAAGAGALILLLALAAAPKTPGRALWAPWLLATAALQLAYWSVLARFAVLLLPPLAFWAAEVLEARWDARRADGVWAAGAAATAALALLCAGADWSHAGASRAVAAGRIAPETAAGRRVWYTGHWGLQEYAEAAGARALDASRGGWAEVRPGDLVVVPATNSNMLGPSAPLRADTAVVEYGSWSPLRLVSARRGEGGFYSSATGFLPWSISNAPADSFSFVSPR